MSPADALWRLAYRGAYRLLLGYWFLRRPEARGVYVALWCRGRVLLVKNSYKRGFTFPAGGLQAEEDPRAGALRELREETGVNLDDALLSEGREFLSREEYKLDRSVVFEAQLPQEPQVRVDGREVSWGAFLKPAEVTQRPLTSIVKQYMAWREEAGWPGAEEGALPQAGS